MEMKKNGMNEKRNTFRRYVVIGLGLLVYLISSVKKTFIRGEMRPTQQKRLTILLVIGGIVLGLFFSMFLYYRFEVWAIRNPNRLYKEVGYYLPDNAQIIYAEARVFSLADGPNYTWLIKTESSLIPWVNQLGGRTGPGPGGWAHVASFYEVAPYEERFKHLGLDSVWQVLARSLRGRDETSYVFIAENHQVALIQTFRP